MIWDDQFRFPKKRDHLVKSQTSIKQNRAHTESRPPTELNESTKRNIYISYSRELITFPEMTKQRMASLQELDLSRNKFDCIPKELESLHQLMTLRMDHNFIKKIEWIAKLPRLNLLSMHNNLLEKIDGLPSTLKNLDLSRNHIQSLPVGLFTLKLQTLLIQSNEYQAIDKSILSLSPTLKMLGLGWGQFCDPKQPILLHEDQLTQWFKEITQITSKTSNEITFEAYVTHFHGMVSVQNQQMDTSKISDFEDSDANFSLSMMRSNCTQRQGSVLIESFTHRYGLDLDENSSFDKNYIVNLSEKEIQSPLPFVKKIDWDLLNQYNQNLMHLAVLSDEIGIVSLLLDINPQMANQVDLKGHTPLSLSIEKQKYRIARILIQKGVDVTIGGGLQCSNLHLAAQSLQWILAKDLLIRGADPDQQDAFGDTPLHSMARGTNHQKVLEFLTQFQQGDINKCNSKGQSVLEILTERGNLLTLQYCHEQNMKNLSLNQYDRIFLFQKINPKTGNSLLHVAIQQIDLKIVIFLLVNRLLNINVENFQNQTPMQLAQLQMRKHYVKSILIMKLLKNSQISQLKILELSYVQTDENESLPLITQGSKFTLIQRSIVSPFKVVKGDEIEELEFLNEMDSHVLDHPCIQRQQDDESGGSSILDEQSPKGLRDTLQRMKVVQPKFQPKQGSSSQNKFSLASFMQGDDPYDYPPPEDEFDSLQKYKHRPKKPNTTTSHISSVSLVPPIYRKGRPFTTNIPKHQNFSPNNIRVIECRGYTLQNRSSSCEKTKRAVLIKKLRALIAECSRNMTSIGPNQFVQWKIEQFRYDIIQRCIKANRECVLIEMAVDPILSNQVTQLSQNFESLRLRVQNPLQVDLLRDYELLN